MEELGRAVGLGKRQEVQFWTYLLRLRSKQDSPGEMFHEHGHTRLEFKKKVWSYLHRMITNHGSRSLQVEKTGKREKPAESRPHGIPTLREGFGRGRRTEKQRNRKKTRIDLCHRIKTTKRTMEGKHRTEPVHCVPDYKNMNLQSNYYSVKLLKRN